MTNPATSPSSNSPRWRFADSDVFARLGEEHRLPVIHSLPGIIVWPILLFAVATAFQLVAIVVWETLGGAATPVDINTVIFTASAAAYATLAAMMWQQFRTYDAHDRAFSIFPVRLSEFALAFMVLVFMVFVAGRLSVMFHDFAMVDPNLTISGGVDRDEVSNVDDFAGTNAALWSVILLTLIAAPIVEEILFRGWMLPMLIARGVPTVFAILISALAFGLLHTSQGLLVITSTFLLGIALGTVRVITGRVAAPVLAHMANNAWAVFAIPRLLEMQGG